MIEIPRHTAIIRLGGTPGQKDVWRTEFAGRDCVTRIIGKDRLRPGFAETIRSLVMRGQGSAVNLPENIQLTVEGYRVAARIPTLSGPVPGIDTLAGVEPRWPQVVDAGLSADGFVYITTEWIDGAALHRILPVAGHLRVPIARGVGRILAALHGANVAYGDLKAENLIIGQNGEVSLIDLDTMREVPSPTIAVPTRDMTVAWAAPEQRQQRETYLASDLWAFGMLVRAVFDAEVPPHWTDLIDACGHPDPLARPNTISVVARLHDPTVPLLDWREQPVQPPKPAASSGSTDGKTERVSDDAGPIGPTVRVEEPTGPTIPRVPSPAPPAPVQPQGSSLRSCLVFSLVGTVVGLATCAGLIGWWDGRQVDLADGAADEAFMALKSYKTRPDVNRDTSQRSSIRAQADAAWNTKDTPHATAVRALALVWEQGWQDSGRQWNEGTYDEGDAAIQGAGAKEPARWMARATLEGGACRLNQAMATSAGHCDQALNALVELEKVLPKEEEWNWMRVEGAWTEVLVRGELAEQAVDAKTAEAPKRLAEVLATCDAAEPYLRFGPVNAIELTQDCLDYAGLATDWPRYLKLADRLFEDSGVTKTTMLRVYKSAGPQCETVSVSQRKSDWSVKGDAFCIAVGHAARGCTASALDLVAKSATSDEGVPWASLQETIQGRAEKCRK